MVTNEWCIKVIFWDITKKNEPELDASWADERKWAAYEEEKYKWTPLYKLETRSESPARQVGPLKMARGYQGTTYFCSTEVIGLSVCSFKLLTYLPNEHNIIQLND